MLPHRECRIPSLLALSASLLLLPLAVSAQSVTPDAYEPDDTRETASPIRVGILGDLETQAHTFHTGTDNDWVRFGVVLGRPYQIFTSNVGLDIWMYAELYNADGSLLDCYDDDEDPEVSLAYTVFPWNTGAYYLRLVNRDCILTFPSTKCGAPVEMDPACTLPGTDAGYDLAIRDNSGAPSTVIPILEELGSEPSTLISGATVWATIVINQEEERFDGVPSEVPGIYIIDLVASGDCTVNTTHPEFLPETAEMECRGTVPLDLALEKLGVPPDIQDFGPLTTTAGAAWTYSPELLAGHPEPTWTLSGEPGGMTVDPNSGQMSWSAPTEGSHPGVTITATNSGGFDSVTFTLHVAGDGTCAASTMGSTSRTESIGFGCGVLLLLGTPLGTLVLVRIRRRK